MGSLGDFAQFAGIEEKSGEQVEAELRKWFNLGIGFTEGKELTGITGSVGACGVPGAQGAPGSATRTVLAAGDVVVNALEKGNEVNVDQLLLDLDDSEIELWKLLRIILNTDFRLFEGKDKDAKPEEDKVSNKDFVFGIFKKINPGVYRSERRDSEDAEVKEDEEQEIEAEEVDVQEEAEEEEGHQEEHEPVVPLAE